MGRARVWAALGSVGVLLLSACGSGEGENDVLSVEQIQQVLLPVSEVPGTLEHLEEHFGTAPRSLEDEEDAGGFNDLFSHECAAALDDLGAVDGENSPQAHGERSVFIEPGTMEGEGAGEHPYLITSITSHEEEASVDQHWDQTQQNCEGEVLEEDSVGGWQLAMESAQVGDFRGLEWNLEHADSPDGTSGYALSYADGHHVVDFIVSDMPDSAIEEIVNQQLALLEEGPAETEEQSSAAEGRDLPEQHLTSGELADMLVGDEEFPFPVEDATREQGGDVFDEQIEDWDLAIMAVHGPVFAGAEDYPGAQECMQIWEGSAEDLLLGQPGNDFALTVAVSDQGTNAAEDLPTIAAIMLQSQEGGSVDPWIGARWASLIDACSGEDPREGVDTSFEEIGIEGVNGFTAAAELTDDAEGPGVEEFSSHVAQMEFGSNSLRVFGFGLTEAEIDELLQAQLEMLETAN